MDEVTVDSETLAMDGVDEVCHPVVIDSPLPEKKGFLSWAQKTWNGGPVEDDFASIAALLDLRTTTLVHAMNRLKQSSNQTFEGKDDLLFRLAAVDLFVEKAQSVLTARARRMSRAGVLASTVAVAALTALSIYIARHAVGTPVANTNELILRVVSAISLGAIVLVAVKYLVSLARSFFHESVTLLSRRHALRFGRMYLYINQTDVSLEHLREAFDWNRGGDSSFLDIKPGEIGQTPWSVVAKSVGDAVTKAIEETQKAAKKGTP